MKTIKEICEMLGVTRRSIQWYEQAGLIHPTERNKYGHLLYDDNQIKKIELIKFYQQIGLSIGEIKEIIDAPNEVIKSVLERQIAELRGKQHQYDLLIEKAYEIINNF